MPARRKNFSTTTAETVPEKGNQVVKTTTEVIRTEQIPEKEVVASAADPKIEILPEAEPVEDDEPDFFLPDDSVFAALVEPETNSIDDLRGSVNVRRKPDIFAQNFAVPCRITTDYPSIPADVSTTRTQIEDTVRASYGGGNYRFQLRYGTGFTPVSWEKTLSDLPPQPPPSAPAAGNVPPASPLQQTESKIQQAMETAMLKKLETMFDEPPAAASPATVVQPILVDNPYALVQSAAQSKDSEFFKTAVEFFKEEKKEENKKTTGWDFAAGVLDTAVGLLDHPERVQAGVQILSTVIGGVMSYLKPDATPNAASPQTGRRATGSPAGNVTNIRQKLAERKRLRETKQTNEANSDGGGTAADTTEKSA